MKLSVNLPIALPLVLFAAVSCSSCTSKTSAPEVPLNRPFFHFDYNAVSQFFIVSNDPASHSWSARFSKDSAGLWQIDELASRPLIDRRANHAFLDHLLDTLRTLKPMSKAPRGTLESYGLSSPRFALKWQLPPANPPGESGAKAPEFELHLGNRAKSDEIGTYAAFSQPTEGQVAYVVEGAALRMLEFITSPSDVRLLTWLTFPEDDVDEVELFARGKSRWYAQRDGANWGDRNHRRLKRDVAGMMEQLFHTRVSEFIDDAALSEKLSAQFGKTAPAELRLTHRDGKVTSLTVAYAPSGRLVGRNGDRAGVVYLYDQTASLFELTKR